MAPEEDANRLGFREWTAHYEKEQEADRGKINDLAGIVSQLGTQISKITANMETLMENQKGLFSRLNRPWQWSVVVSIFLGLFSMSAMFATMASLIIAPLTETIARLDTNQSKEYEINTEVHDSLREEITKLRVQTARSEVDREWINKMEDRLNRRLHSESASQ